MIFLPSLMQYFQNKKIVTFTMEMKNETKTCLSL